MIYDFKMAHLRGAFQREFELWDQYASSSNTREIKKIRSRILSVTRNELTGPAGDLPGVYLFTEPTGHVRYIGIAETNRRPLRVRLEDRLRHDSWFDAQLDHLSDAKLLAKIDMRLGASNPRAAGKHNGSHARMITQYRNCDTIRLFGTTVSSEEIRSAERALIASAVLAGLPLQNSNHRRFRGNIGKSALELARWVVAESADLLNPSLWSRWKQELRSFA